MFYWVFLLFELKFKMVEIIIRRVFFFCVGCGGSVVRSGALRRVRLGISGGLGFYDRVLLVVILFVCR